MGYMIVSGNTPNPLYLGTKFVEVEVSVICLDLNLNFNRMINYRILIMHCLCVDVTFTHMEKLHLLTSQSMI